MMDAQEAMAWLLQLRWKSSVPIFEQALTIRREKLGDEHPDTKKTLESYEETLRKLEEERDG